jgi:hypothetical protein
MLISAREACRILAGAGVSRRCALQVLTAGLAGESLDAGSMTLYDRARVLDLAERRSVRWIDLDEPCPAGFFVSRRDFPVAAERPDQLAALSGGWGAVCPWNWVAMAYQVGRYGSFPFIATIGGFVVLGADIVKTAGLCELTLERPGSWFDTVEDSWLPTGPGRPWKLRLGPLTPQVTGT